MWKGRRLGTGEEAGGGEGEAREQGLGGGICGALPEHLQLLRGVPGLVQEAPPAQACPKLLLFLGLVGGQLLKPDTQTHMHKTPLLLSLCKVRTAW